MSWDTAMRKKRPQSPEKKSAKPGGNGFGIMENAPDLTELVEGINEQVDELQSRRRERVWEKSCRC